MLSPSGLLIRREQLRVAANDLGEYRVHFGFRDGHKAIVGNFEVCLAVSDWLGCSNSDEGTVVEESRVFLSWELYAHVLAPVHECFAVESLLLILVNVSYVVLRI